MVAEGAKPSPGGSTPPPHNPAVNGAKGTAASSAASATAGLVSWWQNLTSHPHGQAVKTAAHNMRSRISTTKFAMPVDVKIDFLRPTVDAVKEATWNVWVTLPPPVQQAAPFVGVAVGSGALVFALQQFRLNRVTTRNDELEGQVKTLKKENHDLVKRINLLKAKSGTPRTEVEARMAAAVAEATNAAAAAADAAARAATACVFQRPIMPPQSDGGGGGLPKGSGPFLQ